MTTFAEHFELGKSQPELDFVDVELETDTELFLDPFAISQRSDNWSKESHAMIANYFQEVIDSIRAGNTQQARALLGHLTEPNETRLGFSKFAPQGAGIGPIQAEKILTALTDSTAVKTGFITSLEESELMVEGVGRDKISDLSTNVLRKRLAEYTLEQCILHDIPTRNTPLPPHFDEVTHQWTSDYHNLPIAEDKPVLLVPKVYVRFHPAYRAANYYRHFVLNYLRAEHLKANSSLVEVLRNGVRRVTKKVLEANYPLTKDFLFQFSKDHPDVLRQYRDTLASIEKNTNLAAISREEEVAVAGMLRKVLQATPGGSESASAYHSLCIGLVEFVFCPQLIYPRKESEINDGRKRIDILAENGAHSGVFKRLSDKRQFPCSHVAIECKNYTREIANPELDQLAGRFSPRRGKLGFLFCRSFDKRDLFIKRCRDTFKDDQGLIIPFDDAAVFELLDTIEHSGRNELDDVLSRRVDEIWVS